MRKYAAFALVLLIWFGSAIAIHDVSWLPYDCSREQKALRMATEEAVRLGEGLAPSLRQARANTPALERLERRCPADINTLMLLGANRQLTQDYRQAVEAYRRGLRIARRPEVYVNLGLSELALGRREDAREHLTMAMRADPLYAWGLVHDVDPLLADEIRNSINSGAVRQR